jgi:hypothetical protein
MVKRYSSSRPAMPSTSSVAFFCTKIVYVISSFHHCVNEIFALLECYAAYIGSYLPTFRNNLSVLSSRVKNMGQVAFLETSANNYQSTPLNIPEERRDTSDLQTTV